MPDIAQQVTRLETFVDAAFAFALTRLPPERRMPVQGFFGATGDAMIILIGWVLARYRQDPVPACDTFTGAAHD
mgnify:CR=1 FL=1